MKHLQTNDFYYFSGFRLDVQKRRLMRDDEPVPLTPKEFELLFFLIQNSDRVVEKDELLEAIWKDTFVEEGTLTRNVSWLRKKLAAHAAGETKFIETLPKRGYRFLPVISKNENAILIEEQTIEHIEIEEIIEIEPNALEIVVNKNQSAKIPSKDFKALPAAPAKRAFSPLFALFVLLILGSTVFIAYRSYSFEKQTKIVVASKIAPFSGLPGRENAPAFSPDGKQMVFSWDGGIEGGNFDIYIKLIGTGDPVRLTNSETDEIKPVFSPDGKSVAFVRVFPTHNEIILISALGGSERVIYEKASYASVSFSPDGKFLAFAELEPSNNAAGIFTINLQTGEKTKLTNPESPAVDHTPRFSPDGKNLAFVRYFNSFHREIFIIPATGGEPRQLTSDAVRIYGLAWNIDSQSLFFTSFRGGNQLNLWKILLNGDQPQVISTGGKNLQDLAVSPDGKTVAFVEETVDENVWEIAPDAAPKPLIRSTRADHSQQISPDGTKIVFASDRTGNYEIWIADADGKNQRQVTDSSASAGSPRFSPDGKFIAFDEQFADGSAVCVTSVNGGTIRRLTEDNENAKLPAWSRDGNWIFFVSNRSGEEQMWKKPASGGASVQITKQGAFEMFAAPDGKSIIYSKGAGKAGLWSVGIDGSEEKPIPELAAAAASRSWTVTSEGVYYILFSVQPPFSLKFFDFATRGTKEIMNIKKAPLTYYSNLCLSPNGKGIVYAQQDQSASTIMLAALD